MSGGRLSGGLKSYDLLQLAAAQRSGKSNGFESKSRA